MSAGFVGWTSFHSDDVMAPWNQSSGTLCHAEATSSLLVMEDTRRMMVVWDHHGSCLESYPCMAAFLFLVLPEGDEKAVDVCACGLVC